jgi:hypothetical protein
MEVRLRRKKNRKATNNSKGWDPVDLIISDILS